MSEKRYDAIVIGAGQAGGPLSTALARSGRKTALIERAEVGGTCINTGCTPTKTLIASGRIAHLVQRAADFGVHTGPLSVDMVKIRQRKRDLVERMRKGSQQRIEQTEGVDLIFGEARFTGHKQVEVQLRDGETTTLSADLIFINTGARPATPSIEGLDSISTLNSTTIMELDLVPDHLLVLGAGYVGLEFAQLFRRLGSQVTIIQRGGQLLSHEDSDMAAEIEQILQEDGIEILLQTTVQRVAQDEQGTIQVWLHSGSASRMITGSHLLVATGRAPNTDMLNLAATGVECDERGYIPVNERLETSVPGIYAMGDVTGGPAFTHISYDDFRIVRTNVIEGGNASTQGRLLPYTIFIDPQFGRVGLSERDAREQGYRIRVAKMPMSHVARAREVGETRGMMKAIVNAENDQILGAAILGIEGGELMSMIQVAMMGRLPYTALREAVFAHPTLAESLNNLFLAMDEE